jgi:hypothetical protein
LDCENWMTVPPTDWPPESVPEEALKFESPL